MNTIMTIENLVKIYQSDEIKTVALDHINLSIEKGLFYAITGKSGSGKSTLLHVVSGMDRPTSGCVKISGKDIHRMKDSEISRFRRQNIGFVYQSYHLLPEFSVAENIKMPVYLDKGKVDEAYFTELTDAFDLTDQTEKFPSQLSGGQRQRVASARAMINRPDIIFADEPTGNLDRRSGEEVIAKLCACQKKFGQTILLVTHDMDIARLADQVIRIEDGKVIQGVA